jgi:hypothetical protein
MAKIIKLKQSDIQRIVENILESNLETEHKDYMGQTEESMDEHNGPEFTVGKDEDGHFYIINKDTNQVIAKK